MNPSKKAPINQPYKKPTTQLRTFPKHLLTDPPTQPAWQTTKKPPKNRENQPTQKPTSNQPPNHKSVNQPNHLRNQSTNQPSKNQPLNKATTTPPKNKAIDGVKTTLGEELKSKEILKKLSFQVEFHNPTISMAQSISLEPVVVATHPDQGTSDWSLSKQGSKRKYYIKGLELEVQRPTWWNMASFGGQKIKPELNQWIHRVIKIQGMAQIP